LKVTNVCVITSNTLSSRI